MQHPTQRQPLAARSIEGRCELWPTRMKGGDVTDVLLDEVKLSSVIQQRGGVQ
jgi:hypothetical protein